MPNSIETIVTRLSLIPIILVLASCDKAYDPACSLTVGTKEDFKRTPGLWVSERIPGQSSWLPQIPQTNGSLPSNALWLDVKSIDLPLDKGAHELHVLATWTAKPPPWLTTYEPNSIVDIVQARDGQWQVYQYLPDDTPAQTRSSPTDKTGFWRVSGAVVNGVLNVCAIYTGGWIAVTRLVQGQWEPWTDVMKSGAGLAPGGIGDVACASVLNPSTNQQELHVCAITSGTGIWHTIETAPGSFLPFGQVTSVAEGNHHEDFFEPLEIDCAGEGSQLHLVVTAAPGGGQYARAWYTARNPSGWRPFTELANLTEGLPSTGLWHVGIGLCNPDVPLQGSASGPQLNVILSGNAKIYSLMHSTNSVQWSGTPTPSNWSPSQEITAINNTTDQFGQPAGPLNQLGNWTGIGVGLRPFKFEP
jgi:hypothetical protein